MAIPCSPCVYRFAARLAALALCLFSPVGVVDAESQLDAGAGGNSASARLMFRIVIPQTLAFSVIDRGAQGPALSLGLRVSDSPQHLIPVSLGKLPLVRCLPLASGQTLCTAATP